MILKKHYEGLRELIGDRGSVFRLGGDFFLAVFGQEDMRVHQYLIGINSQIVMAGAYRSTKFYQLLEEPTTAIDSTITNIHLQIEVFRTKAKD